MIVDPEGTAPALAPVINDEPGHRLGDVVAQRTESAEELAIDRSNGLRGVPGRRPRPEDFTDVLTPEGANGDVVGSEITDDPWVFGEDGSTGGTEV